MNKNNPLTEVYEELCSYENLELAFSKARRGKTLKKYVIDFEKDLEQNLTQLRMELLMQTYQPLPLKTFILRDPKTRIISKSDFRDRVIHHAVCNIIEPTFDKTFIHDSYANRIGKGTLNAIKRFDIFKKKASKNNTKTCYVLKADIKHYFETVNHKILLSILQRKIKDDRVIWLIKKILANHKTKKVGHGMPLGNLTSQFFANVYLNGLDQFVKHKLRAKYYVRYVDDFIILDTSKRTLQNHKNKIDNYLKEHLKLELHPEKSRIITLDKGINFLGFRIFYHHKLLSEKNIRRFEKKLKEMKHLYKTDKIGREKVIEKFEGWLAYTVHADTYKYRKKITSKFNQSFPPKPKIEVSSVKKHETFNNKIYASKIEFTQQKTLQLLKKGYSIKQIAQQRKIKEGTVWKHIADLIEHHQLRLKDLMLTWKVRKILSCIKSPNDKLKDIKARLQDDSISYDEINCVLANVKAKHKKKSITYYIEWYQKTNCYRKCYYNKEQRQICRVKFQQLASETPELQFNKHEFLEFFNNHVNICILPLLEKKRFMSWKEFQKNKKV